MKTFTIIMSAAVLAAAVAYVGQAAPNKGGGPAVYVFVGFSSDQDLTVGNGEAWIRPEVSIPAGALDCTGWTGGSRGLNVTTLGSITGRVCDLLSIVACSAPAQ